MNKSPGLGFRVHEQKPEPPGKMRETDHKAMARCNQDGKHCISDTPTSLSKRMRKSALVDR